MAAVSHKKRKHAHEPASATPHKKPKKDAADSDFHVLDASLVLSIPPAFTADPARGALEMLDSMVMRYIPAFQGVVLSHSHLEFLSPAAHIRLECPFLVCKVAFRATVWRPHIGMKLVGKINLSSPDHISLLLHRTFNVSIPRRHIPEQQWEFEYGAAENDPEFGPAAADADADEEKPVDGDTGGRWVHHLTREPLGGEDKYLSFTVIGLTIANDMLSLIGSMQPDPFDPRHDSVVSRSQQDVEDEDDLPQAPLRAESDDDDANVADIEDEDADDTMLRLGREADEAREAERAAAEKAAAKAAKKEKKKKDGDGKKEKKRKREVVPEGEPQPAEGKKKRKKAS